MGNIGEHEFEDPQANEISLDKLSRLPFALGCATLFCLGSAIVLIVVGLFITWQASDDAKLAAEIAERGERVTVEVTGKDKTRSAAGMSSARTTQFWIEITPVDGATGADGRLAVNQAEHDDATVGDRMEVWRLGSRYELDPVVSDPTPPALGYALLVAGGADLLTAIVLLVATVRRVRHAVA